MKKNFRASTFFKILFFAVLFLGGFSAIVMLLWNNILAGVLHVSVITFWQALGIFVLSKILFGGFHGGGRWGRHQRWKHNMHQRWVNMTPEEREKFKQEWKNRCGDRFGGRFKDSDHFEEQSEPIK
ncbi:MAG: hypothetical protein JST75_00875 [Bacteroidetes bacterium]|nr:hypothetical protein [Bacteroidota bacterium]